MRNYLLLFLLFISTFASGQTLSEKQMQNARATGFAVVAARNPGIKFSIYMIPWDGQNTLEHNAQTQINPSWHAQAAIKGNYFNQAFDGTDFNHYSSVVLSQEEFDKYKGHGTQWWIVCSTLPPFRDGRKDMPKLHVHGNSIVEGNMGIGTTTPDYKLDVEGTIRARELKVDMQGADFVFEDDYQLRSLEEVQDFITTNKHLPDVAPAKEMQEKGVNQSEMNQMLLQKIEELTLYVIDLKKENEKMKSKIKSILESQEQ